MSDDFLRENRKAWLAAIEIAFGSAPPSSAEWDSISSVQKILQPFMGQSLNHVMLPGGGGVDFHSVSESRETGCLEFDLSERSAIVVKPHRLTFEYIDASPRESFLLLELGELKPTGTYENVASESEQLLDLDGEYLDYGLSYEGVLKLDSEGNEIRLPDRTRHVTRKLRGKFLIVAKSGLWNGDSSTYDGRHNSMSAKDVRKVIENSL